MLEEEGSGTDEKSGVLSGKETALEVTEVMTLLVESVGDLWQPVINIRKQIDRAI